ncbi:uncharacterized protein C8Q71DRAFT_779965 [Rhodofomes roseus]|uniref:Uncharacterized protein n=1 Tax=Rhodofomes roseus TaxID=34475 RepID=A0ABQ8K474_9APHY|nr:uncharacterized protein C8Q71DRAFT_779965 [Rhodofomes roseus]KAH9831701.1 hypothetical protein C8Q71DRAFT_779965 [Rhodofomes roseus]
MPRPPCYKSTSSSLHVCLCDEPVLLAQSCLRGRSYSSAFDEHEDSSYISAMHVPGCRIPELDHLSTSHSCCWIGRHPRGRRTARSSATSHTSRPSPACSSIRATSVMQPSSASSQASSVSRLECLCLDKMASRLTLRDTEGATLLQTRIPLSYRSWAPPAATITHQVVYVHQSLLVTLVAYTFTCASLPDTTHFFSFAHY